MDAKSKSELVSIKNELNSIIRELENISNGIRNDFIGIGNAKCSGCIDSVINDYYRVQRKLNNLDTITVTAMFADLHK